MLNAKRVQAQVGSRTVTLETGKLAKQADGAVVITCDETITLVSAVASPDVREGIDFFPLTVDIEERHYSVGRIPGNFFRAEGRPTDKAVLACRLTDRPIRPAFPDGFRHDTQIVALVLQSDKLNPYDVHCITGASAALMLGGIPFAGPIAGVRLAHLRGRWIPFPTYEELDQSTIELTVAGRVEGNDVLVMMIEAGGNEHTVKLIAEGAAPPNEQVLAEGLEAAKEHIRKLCDLQNELVAQVEIPKRTFIKSVDYGDDVMSRVVAVAEGPLKQAVTIAGKQARNDAVDRVKADTIAALVSEFGEEREQEVKNAFRALRKKIMRAQILNEGKRADGRGPKDLRPLAAEVGLLPRAHGSGLFQRGETQVLSVVALAMPRMEAMIDDITPQESERYMHAYKMMPFSTGETGRLGQNRRATGHGALAKKAVYVVVPPEDEFPYAIRVVSEILESNGSTSMASTCASTLALMDAGVPLKGMVGGIAMGLVSEGDKYVVLTDILGEEDNYGDTDFKVAGTPEFVTALQLDTKTTGIPTSVLAQALQQALEARLKIIDVMRQAIPAPRPELSEFAPRIIVEQIPVDKIGELIGPKGKTINEIVARTGVEIDIEDDGRVFIASSDSEGAEKALKLVRSIAKPVPLEVGEEFEGTVVKTTDFGAFVQLMPGKDGLVHISKLGRGKRINKVEEVVKQGDKLWVKIAEIRPDGKLSLVPIDGPGEGNGATSEPESETEDAYAE